MNKWGTDYYILLLCNMTEALNFGGISEAKAMYTTKLLSTLLLLFLFHTVDWVRFPKCETGHVSPISTFLPPCLKCPQKLSTFLELRQNSLTWFLKLCIDCFLPEPEDFCISCSLFQECSSLLSLLNLSLDQSHILTKGEESLEIEPGKGLELL